MSTVSIVGVRGGGKTTALGLLHEGLTSYGVSDKKVQFEVDLPSAPYMYEIVRKLRRGEWPEGTTEGTREEVKLKLRFKKPWPLGWNEMEIDSYDISGEELKHVVDSLSDKSKSPQQVIADLGQRKTLTAVLNSDVFIFIVDSLVCDESNTKEAETKKGDVDTFLGHLCLALQAYKSGTRKNIKAIALVFAKYDMTELLLPLGRVDYHSLKTREALAETEKESEQLRSFEDVMRTYLPTTWNNLNFTLKTVKSSNLKYFRSGVRTVKDEKTGETSVALPLTFTANEYIKVARWLSEI